MAATVITWALVGLAVALVWLSALGILLLRSPLDRLHFTNPVGTLAPLLAAAAAIVHDAGAQAAVKPALVAAVAIWTAPVLAHALGAAVDAAGPR